MLSDYHREIANECNISVGVVNKLASNLGEKNRYIFALQRLEVIFIFRNEAKKIIKCWFLENLNG